MTPPSRSRRSAFTLIELLVVVAIISVLSIVVILALNPAELLRQSRDSNRLSDLANISEAINIYNQDIGGSLGTASTTYISVADPSATSTLGDQCQGLGLPALPTSSTWQCAAGNSYRTTAGSGWVPLNFSAISAGPPIATLPLDPMNKTSTNLFYTYSTNGSQYEVTAIMESQKYKLQFALNPPVPTYPEVDAQGTNLALSTLYNPTGLIGYWNFEEGSGSTAIDQSGNGNVGTWTGTMAGTNGYYSGGKVGNYSGFFDGSTDSVSVTTSSLPYGSSARTMCAWADPLVLGGNRGVFIYGTQATSELSALIAGNTFSNFTTYGPSFPNANFWNTGSWGEACFAYDGSTGNLYGNGVLETSTSSVTVNTVSNIATIGNYLGSRWDGLIDDVRLYNRALSPAEIKALYNAEK